MIISTVPAKNGGRINIYLDGEYAFTTDGDIWYSSSFSDGDDISEREFAEFKELAESRRAYSQALSILTLRTNSEKELRDKLLKKHSPEAVDFAVEKCRELGFIDDEDFAVRYASELYEKKHFAPSRIKQELRLKGIDAQLIENVLESIDFNPVMSIIDVLNKKYPDYEEDEKCRKRAVAGLSRLGYSFSDIKRALKNACDGENFYD